jgi:hypothetical protein
MPMAAESQGLDYGNHERMGGEATKLVSSDRRHNSSQDVHHRPVNSLRRSDRQSNERRSHTSAEPIQNGF